MDVDAAVLAIFIDIAVVIALVVWTNHRAELDRQQRLDRVARRR